MLGNALAHELFDLVKTEPLGTDAAPELCGLQAEHFD